MKRSWIMNNPTQRRSRIPGVRQRMAGAALALAIMLMAVAAITSAQGQTYSVLHTFTGPDGASPAAGVTLDTQGNLFGTTLYGGASNDGTVFKLDKTGKETVLHSFTLTSDGAFPGGPLVLDTQGNLYGSTHSGGVSGNGTVFEVNSTGGETALYNF